jgi:hypothetical protein
MVAKKDARAAAPMRRSPRAASEPRLPGGSPLTVRLACTVVARAAVGALRSRRCTQQAGGGCYLGSSTVHGRRWNE